MQIKFHKALTVGAFVYVFMLLFGVYSAVNNTPLEVTQPEIVMLLTDDGTTENSSKSESDEEDNSPNSRLLIEDDDDSAKDLLSEMHFCPDTYILPPVFHIETYAPYQKEIITPPPKG